MSITPITKRLFVIACVFFQIHTLQRSTLLPDSLPNVMRCVSCFGRKASPIGRILASEPRLLRLKAPAYVFGDFHGNMADLMAFARTMWPLGMHLTPGTFLFLGDYVDRGVFGLEILAYLFAQKIMLPDKVFMLRGNHEVKIVNVSNVEF